MKKVFVILAIGIVGLIVSCQVEYPEPPELILPQDGIVFQNQVPAFIWNSVGSHGEYVIRISKNLLFDLSVLAEDTVADTSYTLPYDIYTTAENGTYAWSVAYLGEGGKPSWSASRTFTLEKSEQVEKTVSELLYDSYFPMDTGYEWVYYEETWGCVGMDFWIIDERYITLRIDSAATLTEGWVIYYFNHDFLLDVGNQVVTNGKKVVLSGGVDTISINSYKSSWGNVEMDRIKAIGVVYQTSYENQGGWYAGSTDYLKFFRKGDTVWRFR